jgi:hypothetical protein
MKKFLENPPKRLEKESGPQENICGLEKENAPITVELSTTHRSNLLPFMASWSDCLHVHTDSGQKSMVSLRGWVPLVRSSEESKLQTRRNAHLSLFL